MKNRVRPINKSLFFSVEEWEQLQGKMCEAGMTSFSAYCRELLLEGKIDHYDFSELKQLNASMGRIAGNINQIAKRCNENKSVHTNEVEQLRREFMALKADYQQRAVKLLRKL